MQNGLTITLTNMTWH